MWSCCILLLPGANTTQNALLGTTLDTCTTFTFEKSAFSHFTPIFHAPVPKMSGFDFSVYHRAGLSALFSPIFRHFSSNRNAANSSHSRLKSLRERKSPSCSCSGFPPKVGSFVATSDYATDSASDGWSATALRRQRRWSPKQHPTETKTYLSPGYLVKIPNHPLEA